MKAGGEPFCIISISIVAIMFIGSAIWEQKYADKPKPTKKKRK